MNLTNGRSVFTIPFTSRLEYQNSGPLMHLIHHARAFQWPSLGQWQHLARSHVALAMSGLARFARYIDMPTPVWYLPCCFGLSLDFSSSLVNTDQDQANVHTVSFLSAFSGSSQQSMALCLHPWHFWHAPLNSSILLPVLLLPLPPLPLILLLFLSLSSLFPLPLLLKGQYACHRWCFNLKYFVLKYFDD